MQDIKVNSKFVCSWGYDQTQYSEYNVVAITGKSVIVEGLNSWSNFSENKLCAGSQVKVYTVKRWERLTEEERTDWTSRGFDAWAYVRHMTEQAEEQAEVLTIKKAGRVNGESWTYLWTLSNGDIVNSREVYDKDIRIKIVKGLKKCLVNTKYGQQRIKIDEVISAHFDPDYDSNAKRYADQNEYTAYNGR